MRYICLEYREEKAWDAMSDGDRDIFFQEYRTFDDRLRESSCIVGAEALQGVQTATTLRIRHGKVLVSDGPFNETTGQLGGIVILEATDLNHAIQLISKHPSLRLGGCCEIRPAEESTTGRSGTDDEWRRFGRL